SLRALPRPARRGGGRGALRGDRRRGGSAPLPRTHPAQRARDRSLLPRRLGGGARGGDPHRGARGGARRRRGAGHRRVPAQGADGQEPRAAAAAGGAQRPAGSARRLPGAEVKRMRRWMILLLATACGGGGGEETGGTNGVPETLSAWNL